MSEKSEKRSLVTKLADVTAAVGRIPKNGLNKFHNYNYVLESDLVEAVRGEYAARHLVVFPMVLEERTELRTTSKGGTENLVTIKVSFLIEDGESGETRQCIIIGQGQDAGDKGSYKAMTGATKYLFMKLHNIATGDDPEAETAPHEQATRVASRPPDAEPSNARPRAAPAHNPQTGEVSAPGAVFPNYGQAKGMPVRGATYNNLQWYRQGCIKSLRDPAKSRFHAKEQELLDAINAELGTAHPSAPVQEDAPF